VTDAPGRGSSALLRHYARVVRSREKPRDRLSSGYIRESAPFPHPLPTAHPDLRLQAPHPSPPSQRRAIPEAPPAPPLRRRGSPRSDPNPMANSNLPRRIIKVCAPDLIAPAQISRPLSIRVIPVSNLSRFSVSGSVQETQRLLSEPGAGALCLAVASDFSMIFYFFRGVGLVFVVSMVLN
jgi:hypothetical protein